MKNVFLFTLLCASFISKSQFVISTSTTGQCFSSNPSATVAAWVSTIPANAATYSWTVLSPSCAGSATALAIDGSSVSLSFSCCGVFTITCSAYTSTNSLISSTTGIVSIYCLPVVVASVSQSSVCSGNTVTFTSSGALTYTWNAQNGINPSSGVPYFPSLSQNYTVAGTSSQGCVNYATVSLSVVNTPTQNAVATPSLICLGGSATISSSGATNYTWAPTGSFLGASTPSAVVFPVATTVYTVSKSNGPCVFTKTVTVIVNNPPAVFAIASPTAICPGGTSTLMAGGGVSYTLFSPSFPPSSGNNAVVSPTVTSTYTYAASDGTCVNTSIVSVAVLQNPTINIAPSNTVLCAGQCANLLVFGGSTYTWTTNPVSVPPTGSNVVICPTVSTIYMVTASNGSCSSQNQQLVFVNSLPSLSISTSVQPPAITCGNSITLQAVASTNVGYAWSTAATTSSIFAAPLQSTCYSVTVTLLSTGCSNSAVTCVTVNPAQLFPSGNSTVCMGSSSNLSLTVPGSFSWQPGSLTGTLVNVLPQNQTTYSVTGVLSGCPAFGTITVFPDPLCAIVWPGDANSDGAVNSSDVFELGLAFNATGAARSTPGNSWGGYLASVWNGTVSTGSNLVHADCDGNGTINMADTIAIFNNYNLTHAFRQTQSQFVPITIAPESPVVGYGWSKAYIELADPSSKVQNVYGVAFTVGFDTTVIKNAFIKYLPSFLNTSITNVEFRKTDPSGDAIHAVTVRTDKQGVTGSGAIAEFWFHPKEDLPDDTRISLLLSGTKMINASGAETLLSPVDASVKYYKNPVGLTNVITRSQVSLYPNPTNGMLQVYSTLEIQKISVYDLPGRLLMDQHSASALDLRVLAPGSYFVVVEVNGQTLCRKIVKE